MATAKSKTFKTLQALCAIAALGQVAPALADTNVQNSAGATIRINPYTIDASYNKSTSASVQATGIAGFQLAPQTYANPLDYLKTQAATHNSGSLTSTTTSNLIGTGSTCTSASGQPSICKSAGAESALISVSSGNPLLADVYSVTDTTGTFSLDISSKNSDILTRNNTISAPTAGEIGVRVSGASSYNVSQQGVAGITAEVLSPTKVLLNTDAAGGGSTGIINLKTSSQANGVQETYMTQGSVSIDAASASLKANTTNHIAVNATNTAISDTTTVNKSSGTLQFTNNNIVAVTQAQELVDSETGLKRLTQKAVLADANYLTKDATKGAMSVKITNDPADSLRTFVANKDSGQYNQSTVAYIKSDDTLDNSGSSVTAANVVAGAYKLRSGSASDYTTACTSGYLAWWSGGRCVGGSSAGKILLNDNNAKSFVVNQTMLAQEAAPDVSLKDGTITLPNYSTQQLTASGVSWVSSAGVTSAQQTRAGNAETWNGAITSGSTSNLNPSGSYAQKTSVDTNRASLASNAASAATARGANSVSNVTINSAAGGGGQNAITSGGFGNTVNLQTTFDMTVFGR